MEFTPVKLALRYCEMDFTHINLALHYCEMNFRPVKLIFHVVWQCVFPKTKNYGRKNTVLARGKHLSGRNFLFSEKHTAKQREKSILLVTN